MANIGYFLKYDGEPITVQEAYYDKVYIVDSSEHTRSFKVMLESLSAGDTIFTRNFATLAKTNRQIEKVFEAIESVHVDLVLLDYQLNSATNRDMFIKLYKSLNTFSHKSKSVLVKHGMKVAESEGIHLGRASLPDEKVQEALDLYHAKTMSVRELCKRVGISQGTLYKYLKAERGL